MVRGKQEHRLDASKTYYRFLVLFFNCMLTFGSYFCFDMPSVLQNSFTGTFGWNCTTDNLTNKTTCEEHLGLTETEYNLLYTVYAWMNALVVIGSGIFIDKVGQRIGALVFSGLCVVGSSIFAAGYFLRGHSSMLVLFLVGRLIFGAGNGSLTIAQNRMSAYWFEGKELAFAFGATLSFSRLGSILNFLLTKDFAKKYGLKWTLWGGVFLCIGGFFGALVLYFLDKNGMQQFDKEKPKGPKRKMKFSDIRHLSIQFVLLSLTTMCFYNTVFPFVADASAFIQDKYHYSPNDETPAYYAGSVYDISLVLTPIFGILVDYVGYRGVMALVCSVLTIPVFLILAFTSWHPLAGTLLLGLTYSAAATSLWPSVPLVVNPGVLGTAYGLMTSMQMVGIGVCTLVVGAILDKTKETGHKWEYVMVFLLCNGVVCVICSLVLNFVDWKRDGILNKTNKRTAKKEIVSDGAQDTDALVSDTDDGHSINA